MITTKSNPANGCTLREHVLNELRELYAEGLSARRDATLILVSADEMLARLERLARGVKSGTLGSGDALAILRGGAHEDGLRVEFAAFRLEWGTAKLSGHYFCQRFQDVMRRVAAGEFLIGELFALGLDPREFYDFAPAQG